MPRGIESTKSVICTFKSRHVGLDHHMVRYYYTKTKQVIPIQIPGSQNPADLLTKNIAVPLFRNVVSPK